MAISVITTSTTTQTSAIELDTEAQALVNELRTLRDQSTALEKQKAVIRDQLLETLGEAEVGMVNGVVRLRQRDEVRRSVSYDELLTLFPEAYEVVVRENTCKKLDIK
jgi:predicted phage-related endonuclease